MKKPQDEALRPVSSSLHLEFFFKVRMTIYKVKEINISQIIKFFKIKLRTLDIEF